MGYSRAMPKPVAVSLRKSIESALHRGHPWVWSDALAPVHAEPGDIATVRDARDRFVARGIVDEAPIGVRVFTTRDEAVGEALFEARVRQALALRRQVAAPDTDCWRLLHGEGDRLPGFVCDVYGARAVLVCDGPGAEAWRPVMLAVLQRVLPECGVTTLLSRTGRGESRAVTAAWGELPEGTVAVRERGMTLLVDLANGQKTGLFIDQRESRARVRAMAKGLRVLNLYGYTGGFSVAAGLGGARHVTTVDLSQGATGLATETWAANGLAAEGHLAVTSDVPKYLAAESKRGARYDLVIADPPSFAPREDTVEVAMKSYRALHTACLALVAPGGFYLAGSCSSHVRMAMFDASIEDAAASARKVLQVVDRWGAPADHPRLMAFPEGDYLKNVLVRTAT
jgi:23S rRNA (cytosine1962-C5)-methyltransferase